MSDQQSDRSPRSDKGRRESDWERRRRLAEVFGDALPETTSDEREPGERPRPGRKSPQDEWLEEQVPPHHG
ncbi:hypothetical protein ACFP3Q_13940 [Nocardioides sp. GCM10027113]|uniref:hypothetical protein n=1 Tax=unclassified Nocardioides TaxID=2615069 RepID=UPI003614D1C0